MTLFPLTRRRMRASAIVYDREGSSFRWRGRLTSTDRLLDGAQLSSVGITPALGPRSRRRGQRPRSGGTKGIQLSFDCNYRRSLERLEAIPA